MARQYSVDLHCRNPAPDSAQHSEMSGSLCLSSRLALDRSIATDNGAMEAVGVLWDAVSVPNVGDSFGLAELHREGRWQSALVGGFEAAQAVESVSSKSP